jgi:MFS family permease
MYVVLRFIAGVGLAGELGAAVTLVGESLPTHLRGYSTAFIAAVGILGAIFAAIVAKFLDWRIAFAFGGILGFALLAGRMKLSDSKLFRDVTDSNMPKGNFFMLFYPWQRLRRYVGTFLIGVPCWFVLGVLLAFGPEVTHELGVQTSIVVGTGVVFQYFGAAVGDFLTGYISQKIKSRKKVLAFTIISTALLVMLFLAFKNMPAVYYYVLYLGLGFTTGYWAVFVTITAEQFGTNLRATAASTIPNFVRGSIIPITLSIQLLRPGVGFISAIAIVGVIVFSASLFALKHLDETYSRDLDFFET